MSEFTTQALGKVATLPKTLNQSVTEAQTLVPVQMAQATGNLDDERVLTALIDITAFINSEQQLMLFNF